MTPQQHLPTKLRRQRCFFFGVAYGEHAIWRHFWRQGQELARRGHRVVMIVNERRTDAEDHFGNPAIVTWPSPRPTGWRDGRFLHRLIKQERPDCLVATFGAVNWFMTLGKWHRVPVRAAWYVTMSNSNYVDHGRPGLIGRLREKRRGLIYRWATHLIPNSTAVSADLQQSFGVPANKCHVQYLSMPDPLAGDESKVMPPTQRTRPVCVGRLNRTKGQDVLVRAVQRLAGEFPDLKIDLVGDGPMEGELRQLMAELGVADRFNFLGRLPLAEVLKKNGAAMFSIIPSRSEAFGLVNIEALSVGTPVIGTQVGGIEEIIAAGKTGLLVPPDDPAALADAIATLLRDPARRAELTAAARTGFKRFDQEVIVPQQAEWFENLGIG